MNTKQTSLARKADAQRVALPMENTTMPTAFSDLEWQLIYALLLREYLQHDDCQECEICASIDHVCRRIFDADPCPYRLGKVLDEASRRRSHLYD